MTRETFQEASKKLDDIKAIEDTLGAIHCISLYDPQKAKGTINERRYTPLLKLFNHKRTETSKEEATARLFNGIDAHGVVDVPVDDELLELLRTHYERKLMKANAEFAQLMVGNDTSTPAFDVIGDSEVDIEIGRMIAKTNRRLAQLKAKPIYSMVPPWVKYPIIPAKSIGWRIGGEPDKYLSEFRDWWSTLDTDQKETYREIYPAPESWRELCRKHGGEFFYDN